MWMKTCLGAKPPTTGKVIPFAYSIISHVQFMYSTDQHYILCQLIYTALKDPCQLSPFSVLAKSLILHDEMISYIALL